MIKIFMIFSTLILFVMTADAQTINPDYDPALSGILNADEYGMKNYFFVILKTGSNLSEDKTLIDSVFRGHMQNINLLAENGTLVLAGPFGANDKNYRGLYIFNAKDLNEVTELVSTDPAVKAKFLEPEIYPWYGSAAVQEINKIHNKISKYKF
ncbi:MAG: YciI family protein [Ignavibacteria bacterium]